MLCVVGVLSLLTGACDEQAAAGSAHARRWPVGAAGIACQLLEYEGRHGDASPDETKGGGQADPRQTSSGEAGSGQASPEAGPPGPSDPPGPPADASPLAPYGEPVDGGRVTRHLGIGFDVAAGGRQDTTLSCALTRSASHLPYLTFAMTPTTIDSVVFSGAVKPAGAYVVPDIGVIAYRTTVAATEAAGPGIEVVWLSNAGRLVVLEYVCEVAATPEQVEELTGKLLDLARSVETTLTESTLPTGPS